MRYLILSALFIISCVTDSSQDKDPNPDPKQNITYSIDTLVIVIHTIDTLIDTVYIVNKPPISTKGNGFGNLLFGVTNEEAKAYLTNLNISYEIDPSNSDLIFSAKYYDFEFDVRIIFSNGIFGAYSLTYGYCTSGCLAQEVDKGIEFILKNLITSPLGEVQTVGIADPMTYFYSQKIGNVLSYKDDKIEAIIGWEHTRAIIGVVKL